METASPVLQHFRRLMESESAHVLVVLLVVALTALFLLVFFKAYRPVLFLLVIGQTFSLGGGGMQGILTLLRFGALFALFPLGLLGLR